jgi:adenylate cyclase class 2
VRRLLEELGAVFKPPVEQVDLYFDHPSRDFKQTDEALRLRQVGTANYVTYKGPKVDPHTKTRREIELPLASGPEGLAAFAELLTVLGFRRVLEVRKVRTSATLNWEGGPIEAALDDVAGLGSYVELEVVTAAHEMEGAKARLATLASRLGLSASERRGYLDLLLSKLTQVLK